MEAMCAVATLDTKSLPTKERVSVRNMQAVNNKFNMHHTDINECALGIHGCNQNGTNTNGSYMCSCYLGYQISSNNRTCVGKKIHSQCITQ